MLKNEKRSTEMRVGRRTFLKGMLATAGLAACGDTPPAVYDPETAPRKMRGYYSLANTPFFELRNGRLINVVKNFPPAIDFHSHLGFWVGGAADNLTSDDLPMKYLMDCDNVDDCHLDLDVYLNYLASESMLRSVDSALVTGPFFRKGPIMTHTVANSVRELDEMQFDKAVLLPIKMELVAASANNMEKRWSDAIEATGQQDRFELYTCVSPRREGWLEDLEAAAARGAKGIKFHPTMQQTAPNSLEAMELFHHCERLNLDVFFHAGRAGIEPAPMQPYALMENYIAPLEEFKKIQFIFGHSGARDWEEAFEIAKQYDNVWMELAGPGIPAMKQMCEEFDSERIIFGSDWPFYPLAASLMKVFHVAHGDDDLRDRLVSHNARRLLRLS